MLLWLVRLLAQLPLSWIRGLGGTVGQLSFKFSKSWQARTRDHLTQAGYQGEELERIMRQVGRETGIQAIEGIWVWYGHPDKVLERVTVTPEAKALLDSVCLGGDPLCLMTPHLGCFEVLPVWYAKQYYETHGRSMSILYRPAKQGFIRQLQEDARRTPGIVACSTTPRGMRQFIENLKNGHTIGVLPDHVPSRGDGVWVPFFGRLAYTTTFPQRMARRFHAKRVFAWGIRTARGWEVHAREWDTPLTGNDEIDATDLNRTLESIIREAPQQYTWGYNRYRVTHNAKPKPTDKPADAPATPEKEAEHG